MLDDGHPIPESSIIVEYLNSISEDVKLISDNPTEARKTRFLDRMYDFYLNNPIGTKFFELRKPHEEQSQQVLDDVDEKINIMYNNMEDNFAGKTWNRGDSFTMADCACIPALFYAQQLAPFSDKPNIQAFWNRACERESVQKYRHKLGHIWKQCKIVKRILPKTLYTPYRFYSYLSFLSSRLRGSDGLVM